MAGHGSGVDPSGRHGKPRGRVRRRRPARRRLRSAHGLRATAGRIIAVSCEILESVMTTGTLPNDAALAWPALPLAEWQDTYATLHLWTQVVGKVRLALAPPDQPLVAGDALRHAARAHHLGHPARHAAPSRSTSTSSTIELRIADQRRHGPHAAAAPAAGGRLLRRVPGRAPGARTSSPDLAGSRSRSRTRSPSRGPRSTPPTTPTRRSASGGSWCRRTGCSPSSARGSSAR